ncbi:MAG: hypothetical protein PHR06_16660, partial [Candidatus Cloacimonetes bacterium]|nr:hypothetical protein [Candidatus Cloacimonadota bacterium]
KVFSIPTSPIFSIPFWVREQISFLPGEVHPTFHSIFLKITNFSDSVFARDMINLDYLQKVVKID